ncbi:MAG: hypothetical protein DRH24_13510, partial [Deltaproteobacteria bacterium]
MLSFKRRLFLKLFHLRNVIVIDSFRKSWRPTEKELWNALSHKVKRDCGDLTSVIETWEKRLKSDFLAVYNSDFEREFINNFPEEKKIIFEKANDIICGKYVLFFDFRVDLGEEIDWHTTLINNDRWPVVYFRDYDLRELVAVGDVRTTWELNRHLSWVILGKAYFLGRDEKFFGAFWHLFCSWSEQNPFLMGVNWLSAMEVGIRLNHWLVAYTLFCDCPSFGAEKKAMFWSKVYLHMLYVRYHFTSEDRGFRNNHLIFEAASLFIVTTLFPEFKKSRGWRKKSEKILSQELLQQFLDDGFHEELCTSYHLQVVEAYLLSSLISKRCRCEKFPNEWMDSISTMVHALLSISQRDGTLPQWGDGDDGSFLNFSTHRDKLSIRTVWMMYMAIVADEDGVFSECWVDEGAVWILGIHSDLLYNESLQKTVLNNRCKHRLSCLDSSQFASVKYFRDDIGEIYLLFSAGTKVPYESYGHRHADLLSIVLTVGDSLLVDPGTYCYNGPLKWRRYFQETRVHNTVLIGNKGQFGFRGNFGIDRIDYQSGIKSWEENDIIVLKGWYIDKTRRLWHCRHIIFWLPNFILIHDYCGEGPFSEANLNYTFASEIEVLSSENGFVTTNNRGKKYQWHIYSSGNNSHPSFKIGDGWVSSSYWERKKCKYVRTGAKGVCNAFMTIVGLSDCGNYRRCTTKVTCSETVET